MAALEIVHGSVRNRTVTKMLLDNLERLNLTGTLYLGYPVLASADERVPVDALLVGPNLGVVAFVLADTGAPSSSAVEQWTELQTVQDRLFFVLETYLARHEGLRSRRKLAVPLSVVTLFPDAPNPPKGIVDGAFESLDHIERAIKSEPAIDPIVYRHLQAALQRITALRPPKKRASISNPNSRGAILKQIESEIANLDRWQKRAAIETPDAPQRIRGLAGSGKTVVLALKAAYLHAQHPEWRIALTFQSRSLYQQIRDLIRRFSFEHTGDEPDWTRLQVLHAWGGKDRDGVYTQIARHINSPVRDYVYARATYGMDDAFKGVCDETLAITNAMGNVQPLYDVVLIDEAQDLPASFFRLIYKYTEDPKRIVWAYDELQKLSETAMPGMDELFGVDAQGQPLVRLANPPNGPRQDIVLQVCYRNTPWALTVAHSLGLGLERVKGKVQAFDDPNLWSEVGYQIVSGALQPGSKVCLERSPDSYPPYFTQLLSPSDALSIHPFNDEIQQAEWVAAEIETNLKVDELEMDDILIVLPSAYTAKPDMMPLASALARRGIASHLAGVTSSRDELFVKNSIAMAHIFRSKGNEAPVVYVVNSQHVTYGADLVTRRNTLFTAITRSRAWVRICGYGVGMSQVVAEADAVIKRGYRLEFVVPTTAELARIRQIHRERSDQELARAKRAEDGLRAFLEAVRRGDVSLDTLPPELRTNLSFVMNREDQESDDSDVE